MPYQENSLNSEVVPIEMEPVYRTASVNQCVTIRSGDMTISKDGPKEDGTGEIRLEWLPVPEFAFHWQSRPIELSMLETFRKGTEVHNELGDATLSVDAQDVRVDVRSLGSLHSGVEQPLTKRGYVYNWESSGPPTILSVIFHVPNFRSFRGTPIRSESGLSVRAGRCTFETSLWRITLDELRNESQEGNFAQQIEAAGGFGITHVGKIERTDNSDFSTTEARKILESLSWYFSFCRGLWVAPMLAVGMDSHGKQCWREWRNWKVSRWMRVGSWSKSITHVDLGQVLPGFLRRRDSEMWSRPIELAMHWYVESNMCAGGVEGALILTQAAFELLAWTLFVEDQRTLSEEGFQKLPAADKLRLLFSWCKIPLEFPSPLAELAAGAREYNWKDSPEALTEIRNALVHANPKKRNRVLEKAAALRGQAWWLGLWYLELVLLKLLEFRGRYANRLVQAGVKGDEIEVVPWALNSPQLQ